MKYLITGSSGHLGEAIARIAAKRGDAWVGLDVKPGPFTTAAGSITDPGLVADCMKGVDVVLHTATLHKPHVATHSAQDFIDVNIKGTQMLLSAAAREGLQAFIFTSTTSAFGDALTPPPGNPAAWITEDITPCTKNIYGATKLAAEDLCRLAYRLDGLPCLILRTSRFFPEEQDDALLRAGYSTENAQVNEFLNRRVDIEDAAQAHFLAAEKAGEIGFDLFIISATTPLVRGDLAALRTAAPALIETYTPYRDVFEERGWSMFPSIDRVYVNARARMRLGWRPKHDFAAILARLAGGGRALSALAYEVGVKRYHDQTFDDGPFPIDAREPGYRRS